MKKEIRGLIAHLYEDKEQNASLQIYINDEGTNIINIDKDLFIYYHWVLSDGKVINFETGDLEGAILLDEECDEDDCDED